LWPAIHFIEVKYRRRAAWGDGFEAITRDKLNRLRRAALAWVQAHHYAGDYHIDVVSVVGELDGPNIEYLTDVIGE
jgi:Holliday junction resolvase-like predicted endonuclease